MENTSLDCFSISLWHSIPLIAIFCSQNWNFCVSMVFVYNGLKVDWLKINKLYLIPAILIPVQLKNNICLWRCIDFEIVLYHTLCLYVEYAVLCGIITWFVVHCFSSVHCTQCIVQIYCTLESHRVWWPSPVLVNTVNRYFVIYAAIKYTPLYWNSFIRIPLQTSMY